MQINYIYHNNIIIIYTYISYIYNYILCIYKHESFIPLIQTYNNKRPFERPLLLTPTAVSPRPQGAAPCHAANPRFWRFVARVHLGSTSQRRIHESAADGGTTRFGPPERSPKSREK